MIYLERPAGLLLVLLIPLFIILTRTGFFTRPAFPLILGDWGLPVFSWRSPLTRIIRIAGTIAAVLSFVFAVFAFTGPGILRHETVYSTTGNTVMFVIDVSPSMAAADMDGLTRLDMGKKYIHDFTADRTGTAFGLTALGTSAALLVPPTADHRLFLERLDSLAVGEFGDGTALGLGLAVAAAHTVTDSRVPVTVVLLTDGENNAGEVHPETAAGLIASRNIHFFVIGIGSRGAVPVDYIDPVSGVHYSGVLDSDFNEDSLAAIAEAGNGSYIPAQDRQGMQEVFLVLDRTVPVVSSSWSRTVEKPLSGLILRYVLAFAGVAWLCRRIFLGAVI